MGVTLQLILGIFLALSQCSTAKTLSPRVIRQAASPPPATPHNVTEINNRDLNKIVQDHPKTETKSSRLHIPLEFNQKAQESTTQKEAAQRTENGRSIDVDSAKFWSPEFHSKNNFFTIPSSSSTTEGDKFAIDVNAELTTPTTQLFDRKYKETVESVDQSIDDSLEPDEDDDSDDLKNLDFTNGTLEFVKTKTIVNNETVDKNSIHKDVNIEETRNVSFESAFNDTQTYDEDDSTTPKSTTQKNSFAKIVTETNNSHLLNNKIESETVKSVPRYKVSVVVTTTTVVTSTTTEPQKNKFSEPIENNQVIPLQLGENDNEKRSTTVTQSTTTVLLNSSTSTEFVDETTTELVSSTTLLDTSSTVDLLDTETTTLSPTTTEESTTSSVDFSTATEEVTTVADDDSRASKSLKTTTLVTEATTEPNPTTTETTTDPSTTTTVDEVEYTTFTDVPTTEQTSSIIVTTEPDESTTLSIHHLISAPVEVRKVNLTVPVTTSEPFTNHSTEEEETEPPTENPLTNDEGKNKGTIAAIVISSVGAVCLILLAGLLYVMRKRQKRFNYGPRCTPVSLDEYSIDNLSVYNSVRRKGAARMSKRSFGNPAFEDPVVSHPLNFPALAKFATNFEDVKAEFEDIPQITARTSELPEGCDSKNRYANVIPLPETRVFLKFIDGYQNSDYINANYVTGPKNVRGYYIATQGPMQNTVDDFWRMIWEQNVKVVLMLTHLVENGLEKCVDYLPESEVVDNHRMFGDFQITLKKREVKDKYIISSLQLKNMVSNSWREVTHFWYLGWPERGVPSEANSLIAFLIEARSYMKTVTLDRKNGANGNIQTDGALNGDHSPVVVHCSPGTGRTGVAIACDIAIREFETTRLVDIPKIVYRIRRDRANAIQTKEQYQFIYKVVTLYATKLTGGVLDNF